MRADKLFQGGIGLYANFVHIDTRGWNADWTGSEASPNRALACFTRSASAKHASKLMRPKPTSFCQPEQWDWAVRP